MSFHQLEQPLFRPVLCAVAGRASSAPLPYTAVSWGGVGVSVWRLSAGWQAMSWDGGGGVEVPNKGEFPRRAPRLLLGMYGTMYVHTCVRNTRNLPGMTTGTGKGKGMVHAMGDHGRAMGASRWSPIQKTETNSARSPKNKPRRDAIPEHTMYTVLVTKAKCYAAQIIRSRGI